MTEQERIEEMKKLVNKKLVNEAIDKFENETGTTVSRNSTPRNYQTFVDKLNEISYDLPNRDPEKFGRATGDEAIKSESSGKKFEITPVQIRDARRGEVANMKSYTTEALHWYLYNKPSRLAEPAPDEKAGQFAFEESNDKRSEYGKERAGLIRQSTASPNQGSDLRKQNKIAWVVAAIFGIAAVFFAWKWVSANREATVAKTQIDSTRNQFAVLKRDMRILPYLPTQAEIARLEGVYLVYTASPQARKSDPDRYHKVVPNILVVTYKEGYFTFDRYGHDFDQKGYMQFERPGLVSMHSYMIDSSGTPSPKKTLLETGTGKDTFAVISSSWSFDPNPQDNISIGIREVFIKIGKPGSVTQIVNSPRNFGKNGKLFDLKKEDGTIETLHIQNERLESLPKAIQTLLNEKSILLKDPDPMVILE